MIKPDKIFLNFLNFVTWLGKRLESVEMDDVEKAKLYSDIQNEKERSILLYVFMEALKMNKPDEKLLNFVTWLGKRLEPIEMDDVEKAKLFSDIQNEMEKSLKEDNKNERI